MSENCRSLVEGTLTQDAFIMINKKLFYALEGHCTAALVLGELISLSRIYYERSKNDWFFMTVPYMERSLMIKKYVQNRVLKELELKGFIETALQGCPPRRYIRVCHDVIWRVISVEGVRALPDIDKGSTKKEFYQSINDAMELPFNAAVKFFGNIPKYIVQFMYVWSRLYSSSNGRPWIWTPSLYGMISTYLKSNYGQFKKFDYNVLLKYLDSKKEEDASVLLYSFIEHDKATEETHPDDKMSFAQFLETIQEEG